MTVAARSASRATQGAYLTATTTTTAAKIPLRRTGFSPPTRRVRPSWNQLYANNFNDSGIVRRRLPAGLRRDHQPLLDGVQRPRVLRDQLGRRRRIENSQFDNNEDGADTNTP